MFQLAPSRVLGPIAVRAVGVGVLLLLGLHARRACADPPRAPPDDASDHGKYPLSVRPLGLGFGGGDLGIGARVGGSGEFWITDNFGVGVEGGFIEQAALLGASSAATFLAPTLGVRGALRSGIYAVGTFGVGYARGERNSARPLFCLSDPCAPAESSSYDGHSINGAFGVFFHPKGGVLEVGPVLRLEAFVGDRAPTDDLVTLNIEIGFALPRR